jgi:NADPH:quinone reductase-like Zn-dependent oxidoreductase
VPALLRVVSAGAILGRLTGRRIGLHVVNPGPTHFQPTANLCVSGDIRIHIDRTFGLEEVPEALAHVGEGRALGKVVEEVRPSTAG